MQMAQRFREPVIGFTHLIGVPLGFAGLLWLVSLTHDQPDKMLSMVIYGVSIMLLYAASAIFHLVNGSDQTVLVLRRIDHAAIYVLIAGTYTPLVYNILSTSGVWRWLALSVIWGLAGVGILYKLLFLQGHQNRVSLITYLLMGWLGILLLPLALPLIKPGALLLIVGGGVAYSLGAIIFALRRPNFHRHFGHHEIWHLFVLVGSGLHFAAVLGYVAH